MLLSHKTTFSFYFSMIRNALRPPMPHDIKHKITEIIENELKVTSDNIYCEVQIRSPDTTLD